VLNIIDAEYPFQAGRITAHRDHFSVWRWSSQALGPAGMLLGWTPLERAPLGFMAKVCRIVRPTRLTMPYTRAVNAQVRNKVRPTARARLDKFIQAHPAYP
jgi:hypothetical protein